MLSLWILLLGLMAPAGQPDVTVSEAASGYSADSGHVLTAGSWTQPPRLSSLELQIRQPEDLRLKSFASLNGISLDWSREELLKAKGKPLKIVNDEITGYTEYRYADVTAGLYEDTVYYVHVDNKNGEIQVDGRLIPLNNSSLKTNLGTPVYEAEDGDVYGHELNVIKVFRDEHGRLTGADLFSETTS